MCLDFGVSRALNKSLQADLRRLRRALYGLGMIDDKYGVRRFITEFSEATEMLVAEYELSSFDLEKFQKEFGEVSSGDPMFDCYVIRESNISFLKEFIEREPEWDFEANSYFIEAHAI